MKWEESFVHGLAQFLDVYYTNRFLRNKGALASLTATFRVRRTVRKGLKRMQLERATGWLYLR